MMATTSAMPMMAMSSMEMVFFTSSLTPLFSMTWTPSGDGNYAGTCVFLIVLALIYRGLYAVKSSAERSWEKRTRQSRFGRTGNEPTSGLPAEKDVAREQYAFQPLERPRNVGYPWRISVDVPRALLVTVMAGVGYLL